MTIKHWMLLAAFLSGALGSIPLTAQDASPVPADPPPLIPAGEAGPVTPPPAATKAGAKPAQKKSVTPRNSTAPSRQVSDLKPGSAVAMEKNVNVRGQAALNSEIVTHLKRGDVVTVLEQVTTKAGPNEPAKWARISVPEGTVVWVHSAFVDSSTKAVKPNRLNLRSGPGENYSILGRIDKGTVVNEVGRKGDWLKIDAPTGAYAFAAAHLFSQAAGDLTAAISKKTPSAPATAAVENQAAPVKPVETVAVETAPAIVTTPPALTPPVQPPPAGTPDAAPAANPAVAPEPPPPTVTPTPSVIEEAEPLLKRIVTREGIVRGSASIQAPTYFVLRSLDNNRTINYLHAIDTNIVLRSFQHQRVIVIGEEILDERWPNTPVIDVESIETVP